MSKRSGPCKLFCVCESSCLRHSKTVVGTQGLAKEFRIRCPADEVCLCPQEYWLGDIKFQGVSLAGGDTGIELVRLGDEPRLFWHKSNSNDPDRNVWSILDFSLGFRCTLFCRPGNTHCPTSKATLDGSKSPVHHALFDECVMEGPAIRALIAAALPWLADRGLMRRVR